jgi:hypothetical protein
MGQGFSRSPKLLKGAIVQFSSSLIIPIPNIILFQYNPESLSRSLHPYDPRAAGSGGGEAGTPPAAPETQPTNATIQPFDPTESFSLTLLFDAADDLETPEQHPITYVTGVADRIAALEMLLYPVGDSLLGNLVGAIGAALTGGPPQAVRTVPRKEVPVILLVFGPGRIVPIRLINFTVDEQQWNPMLYPHRARVTLGMRVITSAELDKEGDAPQGKELAKFCYDFTRRQKEALATANLSHAAESILGLLPF